MRTSTDTQTAQPNPEFVERCQLEYENNPASRVFAPLSEAYRRMGLVDQAIEVAERGTGLNPDFAAGHLALGRALSEKASYRKALKSFQRATELSPDNLLAFQLLGETHLQLKQAREALDAFKTVLFLNPKHERARKLVQKWEFLESEDFDASQFGWAPNEDNASTDPSSSEREFDVTKKDKEVIRVLSLADALAIRNDLESAFAMIGRAVRELGPTHDLNERLHFLGRRLGLERDDIQSLLEEARQREHSRKLAQSREFSQSRSNASFDRLTESLAQANVRGAADAKSRLGSEAAQSKQARIAKLEKLLQGLARRSRG